MERSILYGLRFENATWNVPKGAETTMLMTHSLLLGIFLERSRSDFEDHWYGHHRQGTTWPIYSTTRTEGDSNGALD